MGAYHFYTAGSSPALNHAIRQLQGCGLSFSTQASQQVTHLLLPVPSLTDNDVLVGGGKLTATLQQLAPDVTVIGGGLPELPQYRCFDLLRDPQYLAQNGYITAHCALRLLLEMLPVPLRGCSILVIGWGRIGKCLAAMLKNLEAQVTVAARKEADRAILRSLGYSAADTHQLHCHGCRAAINTVPHPLLPQLPQGCIKIDLASAPGLSGPEVVYSRGLPGKYAPEASGQLMAQRILSLL